MVGDLRKRIEGAYNKLEEMAKDLPGYKGYKDKEVRRQADKLIRMKVARGFEEQRGRLNSIAMQLADAGRLRVLLTVDRSLMRLQFLIDRLKTASYGYAGLFDAIKVKEAELDALYEYDAALLDDVEKVRMLIDAVDAAEDDDQLTKAGNELLAALEEINETFSKRQDVILELPSV
ncbi:MAG: hypothetical protein JSW37_11635 [Anaerolineales bacterium]|nr:MAG: hypothetical protein JSW37_11635 [Anaerolineales bacterium]